MEQEENKSHLEEIKTAMVIKKNLLMPGHPSQGKSKSGLQLSIACVSAAAVTFTAQPCESGHEPYNFSFPRVDRTLVQPQ